MSNPEPDPQETVCRTQEEAPRLRDGVSVHQGSGGTVEILEPRAVPLGGPRGMSVDRVLPQKARSLIGAWCFLDSYGPDDVASTGGMKVARHPHTGLATVSWLFEGRIDHVDSAGNWATVRPGDVDLMNAGRGITHQEFSTADTSVLHGVQLWYAFPDAERFGEPSLDSHRPEPVAGPGWLARVFLGSLLGSTSPVSTRIPLVGAELRLEPGTELELAVDPEHEHGLLAVQGTPALDGVVVEQGHLAYTPTGRKTLRLRAGDEPLLAVLIGGRPLNEQIVMWWNFVGRNHEEIVRWRSAYMQEMGFEAPEEGSPLRVASGAAGAAPRVDGDGAGTDATSAADDASAADDTGRVRGIEPLGAPVSGELLDATLGRAYGDGRPFPQFGDFPPGQPDPLPAPELPTTRLPLRG